MKAALIAGGVSPSRILELAHDLPAHHVAEAAFLLREMTRRFPVATIHLAVIDPGVGGHRRPIAIVTRAGPLLVGPDNGVLFPLAQELGLRAAYRIDGAKLRRAPPVGTTFEGRDLFAPAAAALARGSRPSALGARIEPTPYTIPVPRPVRRGARGVVLHVDRFGNLITNVPTSWVASGVSNVSLTAGRVRRRSVPWVSSYESLGPGILGALGSSFGLVEIAVAEGRAADRLQAEIGSHVAVEWGPRLAQPGETVNTRRPRKRR